MYKEKIRRIEEHLIENPYDYQSKIQLMILKSKQIDYDDRQAMIPRLRRLAELRRLDEQECEQ